MKRIDANVIKVCVLLAGLIALIGCGGGGSSQTYDISGRVTGLIGGGLELQLNGGDNLAIDSDGVFSFAIALDEGDSYAVTVARQPSKFLHECSVGNGSGTIGTADITDIAVTCANLAFPRLFDEGIVYSNQIYVANGGDDINGDGSQLNPFESIGKAASEATPGTQINIAAGTYNSTSTITDLAGTASAPIALVGAGLVNINPTNGLQVTRPRYLVFDNLSFQGLANGLNIDDGADYANPDAAGYVIVKNSSSSSTGPGNNDAIKASGLSNLFVVNNTLTGAGSGSGIDCVGCRESVFSGNTITGSMASGIQTKGGSADILIHGNVIRDISTSGARGINAGGSTGTTFFRPPLVPIASDPAAENFEAARITMLSNVFSNLDIPVAFTGCIDCVFANNTIVDPRAWVARILQETVSDGTYTFAEVQNGQFINNIIRYSTVDISTIVNIGPNTQPGSFDFDNNLWWAVNEAGSYVTSLPASITAETFSYNQVDPLFTSIPDDLSIAPGSPVIGLGAASVDGAIGRDFDDRDYQSPPALGAFAAP